MKPCTACREARAALHMMVGWKRPTGRLVGDGEPTKWEGGGMIELCESGLGVVQGRIGSDWGREKTLVEGRE